MVLENTLSPHRRSSSFRKQFHREEFGSWSTLVRRHRFLLTALVLLVFLCIVYLYFAVTLGAKASEALCSGLSESEKALCILAHAKAYVAKGKMKFF